MEGQCFRMIVIVVVVVAVDSHSTTTTTSKSTSALTQRAHMTRSYTSPYKTSKLKVAQPSHNSGSITPNSGGWIKRKTKLYRMPLLPHDG